MKIGIVGAGALGCFYGAKLARAGFDVHFLMRRDYAVAKSRGLTVQSGDDDFSIAARCYQEPAAIGICDLVLVGLKTTDNGYYSSLISPLRAEQTMILTLQNGMGNEEELATLFGAERVLGGAAFLCSQRVAPAVVRHSGFGQIEMAEFSGAARARTRRIAALFSKSGVRCDVFDSLRLIRWKKSVWNIPFNGLSVACAAGSRGATVAELLGDAAKEAEVRGLMAEILTAARAEGCDISEGFAEELIVRSRAMGPYKSSMQVDFESGRPLEIEAIIGEPARRATAAGVEAPRLRALYEKLCGIERRRHFR